jgi:hypothetical protein
MTGTARARVQLKSERGDDAHHTEGSMSQTAIIVQGVVKPDGTLELDEKLNVPAGRVQVVVQPLPDLSSDPFWQTMEAIWARQAARGHVPRDEENVESQRRAIRQEIEEEIQEAMRIQEECRRSRDHAEPAQGPNS